MTLDLRKNPDRRLNARTTVLSLLRQKGHQNPCIILRYSANKHHRQTDTQTHTPVICHAAVLIGRITRLARPFVSTSVRPSVCWLATLQAISDPYCQTQCLWQCLSADRLSVRSSACAVYKTSALCCKARGVASHVAYRLVCLSVCQEALNSKTKRRRRNQNCPERCPGQV